MNNSNFENKELLDLVRLSLDKLYLNDKDLFDYDLCERAIVFHFGIYLNEMVKNNTNFYNFSVDCEYNRNMEKLSKKKEIIVLGKKRLSYPDILIHKRGKNNNNKLVIEFKKWNNYNYESHEYDKAKLKALTSKDYKYKLGLFILLGKTRDRVEIDVFKNGRNVGRLPSVIL